MGRFFVLFALLLLPTSLMVGCHGHRSENDGKILFEVPEVQGSEKPFEMPQLSDKLSRDGEFGPGLVMPQITLK